MATSSSRPTNDVTCEGQVARRSASNERRRGKSRGSAGWTIWKHAHRRGQITQPVLTEVDEPDRRPRARHAPTPRSTCESTIWPPCATLIRPCRPVERGAVVVAVARSRLRRCAPRCGSSGRRRHPTTPTSIAQLRVDRGRDAAGRSRERRVHTVARGLHDARHRGCRSPYAGSRRGGRGMSCIASGNSSHRRVEPSMSVNTNVTVPVGSSTIACSHPPVRCHSQAGNGHFVI